jgi:glucose uptake protein GlcU
MISTSEYNSNENIETSPVLINTEILQIKTQQDNIAKISFIIGFIALIIPLLGPIWLMNWVNHRESPSEKARKFARWSIIAEIISIVIFVVLIVFVDIVSVGAMIISRMPH